jgi:hypothetical protein
VRDCEEASYQVVGRRNHLLGAVMRMGEPRTLCAEERRIDRGEE